MTAALAYPKQAVRHALRGTGVVVPRSEGMSISALTWVSSKWQGRAPEDHVLLRAYLGGARDPGAIDLPTDAIVARAHRDVARLLGVTGDPTLTRVYRWPHANAQQEVGHLALMAQIEERLADHPGLFISAAGFRGSGIADCVADGRRQARAAAAQIVGDDLADNRTVGNDIEDNRIVGDDLEVVPYRRTNEDFSRASASNCRTSAACG